MSYWMNVQAILNSSLRCDPEVLGKMRDYADLTKDHVHPSLTDFPPCGSEGSLRYQKLDGGRIAFYAYLRDGYPKHVPDIVAYFNKLILDNPGPCWACAGFLHIETYAAKTTYQHSYLLSSDGCTLISVKES
jgi:hypothetical protein